MSGEQCFHRTYSMETLFPFISGGKLVPSLTTILSLLLVLALVALVVWSQSKEKKTKIRSLWLSILFVMVLCILSFSHAVISSSANVVLLISCGLLGLTIGAASGRLIKLSVDLENDSLIVRGTTISIIVWVVLFIFKQVLHLLESHGAKGMLIDVIGSNVLFVTACSVLGMNLYQYCRYRQARRKASPA